MRPHLIIVLIVVAAAVAAAAGYFLRGESQEAVCRRLAREADPKLAWRADYEKHPWTQAELDKRNEEIKSWNRAERAKEWAAQKWDREHPRATDYERKRFKESLTDKEVSSYPFIPSDSFNLPTLESANAWLTKDGQKANQELAALVLQCVSGRR